MSEPDQLYLRVKISRAQLDAFLQAPCAAASDFDDLHRWLADHRYGGDSLSLDDLEALSAQPFTPQRLIDIMLTWVHPAMQASRYDDASQTWTLSILEFHGNIFLLAVALIAFRGLAQYKDLPSADYFLLFGHYYNSDNVVVAMEITQGSTSILQSAPPQSWLDQAGQDLENMAGQLDGVDSSF